MSSWALSSSPDLSVIHAQGSFTYSQSLVEFFYIVELHSCSECVIGKAQISFLLCSVTGREIL